MFAKSLARAHVLLALAPLGCARTAEPTTPAKTAPASAAPASAAPASAAPARAPATAAPATTAVITPTGRGAVALATVAPRLRGTITLPDEAKTELRSHEEYDADGLATAVEDVRITIGGGAITLSTMAEVPSRYASPDAMARFHSQFPETQRMVWGADHWAVVTSWGEGNDCSLHGWHKAAGLICDVFKRPCVEMPAYLAVCGAIRPDGTPNTPASGPEIAFPELRAPGAAEAAFRLARAFARDQRAELVAAVGPKGLRLMGKQIPPAGVAKALDGDAFAKIRIDRAGETLNWNAQGSETNDRVAVYFTSGYGEQPFFVIEREGARWVLAEVGIEDLGEP